MYSYICLYNFLLFNLISFIFIFLSIYFSYCSLHALKRTQNYTVYACIYFSSLCLFPRLFFCVFLTDEAQLWFDPVYPTWWEFSAFVLFTLTEKWIIFVVHILPQRHLRGVDSTLWWVFPLSNGSRGSCRRGPNGRGDVVGGRGQQRARICQRWTRSVVAVSTEQHWGASCVVMTEDNGEKWKQHGLRSLTEIWTGRRCSPAFWFRYRCGNFLDYSEVTGIFVISVWRKPSRRPEITLTPAEAQPRLAACYKAISLFYSVESYSIR